MGEKEGLCDEPRVFVDFSYRVVKVRLGWAGRRHVDVNVENDKKDE